MLRVEPKDEVASVFTEEELARMVKDSSDAELLSDRDTELLQDALELGSRPVSEVVTPGTEVVFAEPGTTPAQLHRRAVPRPHLQRPDAGTRHPPLNAPHVRPEPTGRRPRPPGAGAPTDHAPIRRTAFRSRSRAAASRPSRPTANAPRA
ncbi:hypothetical protein [Kitasatospora griseola]|uniref:hypothetical protein n=1 Tax=Kitasatospora griseola TaxID=2064 RepID=UPI00364B97E8